MSSRYPASCRAAQSVRFRPESPSPRSPRLEHRLDRGPDDLVGPLAQGAVALPEGVAEGALDRHELAVDQGVAHDPGQHAERRGDDDQRRRAGRARAAARRAVRLPWNDRPDHSDADSERIGSVSARSASRPPVIRACAGDARWPRCDRPRAGSRQAGWPPGARPGREWRRRRGWGGGRR